MGVTASPSRPPFSARPPRSTTASAPSVEYRQEGSSFSTRLLFLLAMLLTINHLGRPFERFLIGYKIPFVLCAIGIVVVIINNPFRLASPKVVRVFVVFSFWMIVCTLFSFWLTGSILYVKSHWTILVPYLLIVASGPLSLRQVQTLLWTTAASCGFSLITGATVFGDRLASTGTFGNADDVALMAGFALPLGVSFALKYSNPLVRYPLMLGIAGFFLRFVGLSATRTAIPALGCMMAIYFWRSSTVQRAMLLAGAAVGVMVMLLILPASVLDRFATLADSFDSEAISANASKDEAYASAADRKDLLFDAITETITHPLFGVGPGNYGVYRNANYKWPNGRAKRIFPSHNTFLQISSEEGIPGMLMYITFLWMIWKTLQAARRYNAPGMHPEWERGQMIVLTLEATLAYFAFCAIFMTCDKHPHQCLLAGAAVATQLISGALAKRAAEARLRAAAAVGTQAAVTAPARRPFFQPRPAY